MLNLSYPLLKAASLAASKDRTRYYLNGVYVEKRGNELRYVATDGHMAFIASQEMPPVHHYVEDFDFIISNGGLKRAFAGCTKKTWFLECELDIPVLPVKQISLNGVSLKLDHNYSDGLIDGIFPNWRAMLNNVSLRDEKLSNFDPALVGRLADIAKALDVDTKSVRMHQNGQDAAVVGFGRSDAMAVLMPLRVGKNDVRLTEHDMKMITGVKLERETAAA